MDLKTPNKERWDNCHIPATNGPLFKQAADRLTDNAAFSRYKAVEKLTTVPWWFIAVVHEREAAQNWDTYLGNGQALDKKTTIVPKGRGPFTTWEEGAVDALTKCAPYAAKNTDWSIGGALSMLEKYNGSGYAQKGLPSPYLWAGTDQYTSGKYTSDGKYNPDVVDSQLGCAGLLKFMGVFKTAPTGIATAAAVTAIAGTTATVAVSTSYWPWVSAHAVPLVVTAIAAGIILDMIFALYNNEKNQLKQVPPNV